MVVASALGLSAGEKLVIIADRNSREIARSLAGAAREVGALAMVFDLDEVGVRPHKVLPEAWCFALALAKSSVFVASSPPDEVAMRQHLLHLVSAYRLRHAHMPNITTKVFVRGVRAGHPRLAAVGQRVLQALSSARRLVCTSPGGTDLVVDLERDAKWFAQLGVLEPGRWGNLPAGALYASPAAINGTFVADASMGEWFGRREGSLGSKPVTFRIRDGHVLDVSAPEPLRREIASLLNAAPNSSRVGLVAVGVNFAIDRPCGDPLVDQNLPGLHLSIGDPAARVTGAKWSAPTSLPICGRDATVSADGVVLIDGGFVR